MARGDSRSSSLREERRGQEGNAQEASRDVRLPDVVYTGALVTLIELYDPYDPYIVACVLCVVGVGCSILRVV